MRAITQEATQAFLSGTAFTKSNTTVITDGGVTTMFLHGNAIAKRENGHLYISCGGWTSNTTKERLNGILSEVDCGYIYQKDYVWYFDDGSEFDTEGWNLIK